MSYSFSSPLPILHNASYRTNFRFNGKELDNETNMYYYGARYYEPAIMTWYGVDPLTEKYPFSSPYVYCNGNPVKYVDVDGRGPEERVEYARNMLGIAYKQETNPELRTADTDAALEFMDCSEFVCRVMAADGMTDGVQYMTSSGIREFLENGDYECSTEHPQIGDIAVWDGHVGIVTEVDGEKIKLAHAATGNTNMTYENRTAIDKNKYTTGAFVGFFRESDNSTYDGGTLPLLEVEGTQNHRVVPVLYINIDLYKPQMPQTNESL